jgi:DNA-binding phage protein
MDMSMIRERMEELGLDLAALNRRYCEIRQAKGDKAATPVNRRNMLAKAISDDGNPTLETFMDIIAALDGEVLVQWKSTTVKKFGG